MKLATIVTAAALVAGIIGAQVVVAEATPAQVLAQCKKDAQADGIAAEDMQGYVRACLEDHGIEAADAESTVDDATPEKTDGDAVSPDQG